MRTLTSHVAVLAVLAIAGPLAAVAHAGPAAPDVPTRIQVEAGNKVFLVGHATGVQIWGCNGSAWALVAPRAVLKDDRGKVIMSHSVGPTWEATDGSAVVGQRLDGVIVDATAIPWLLLSAKPKAGAEEGRLTATSFIQRVNTTGGLAPARACSAGEVVEVPYTADYYFWKAA